MVTNTSYHIQGGDIREVRVEFHSLEATETHWVELHLTRSHSITIFVEEPQDLAHFVAAFQTGVERGVIEQEYEKGLVLVEEAGPEEG